MRLLSALFIVSTLLMATSCEKTGIKKQKDTSSSYYSTDYKDAEGSILDVQIEEIDILYVVFINEDKELRYKLVAEKEAEKNEVLAYEEGKAIVDGDLNITFAPDNASPYTGYFENDKQNFKVSLPDLDSREINFVLKK